MKRRSILQTLGASGAATLGGLLTPRQANAFLFWGREKKADVLMLCGDRWHAFDYLRTAFRRTYVRDMGLKVDFTSDYEMITPDNLKKYDMLFMLMDGMVFHNGYRSPYHLIERGLKLESDPPVEGLDEEHEMWIEYKDGDPCDQGLVIKEFVENGGGAMFFHNTHYNAGVNEHFRDVIGGNFIGHTRFRPFRMEITNSDHPIARGVGDFTITEEQHYLFHDKDPAHVFMRSRDLDGEEYESREHGNRGSTCEAGWAHDYGKGRVVFMTPGHTIPTLWNPEFIKLQQNAVRWLRKEI